MQYGHAQSIIENSYFRFLIVFFWTSGILLGLYVTYNTPAGLFSLMHGVSFELVSIVTRFLILLLPFVVTAILFYYKLPFLLFVPVLFKAFLFTYCSSYLWDSFESAGWLVRGLLMFFDILTAPVLLFIWLRFCDSNNRRGKIYLLGSIIYALFIFCIDAILISPLALSLFHKS